jgi:sterol desaturase/sphingolipid hydroxylase (fatty acid hydroxylase superfamily)
MLAPVFKTLLLVALVFVPLERLATLRRDQRVFRSLWHVDALYALLNPALIGLGIDAFLFVVLSLTSWMVPAPFRAWVGSRPFALQLAALIVLSDLGFYGVHRLFHAVPQLWKLHAIHHSIEHMDWLAAYRVHPIDQILTKGASLLPVFALGFSAWPIAAYGFLYQWQAVLIHSNVHLGFGPVGRIVASPRFHHWHHANHPEAFDKNFAGQLSILDRLFGTFHLPEREYPRRYGTDVPVPPRYAAQLISPFVTRSQPEARQPEPKVLAVPPTA